MCDVYVRDLGSIGQLDLKRPVVKGVEATSDRLKQREAVCVSIDSF